MGRKKRNRALLKPFCFYCERQFDEEKILVHHQKAKHFKCLHCSRKLDTAAGLVVHMLQVHKETISRVPNAIPGRDQPDLMVHGMQGVPPEIVTERQRKIAEEKGLVKKLKTAHSTMGVLQMNTFMDNTPALPALPGFDPAANPALFSQFVNYMKLYGVRAAFASIFGFDPEPLIAGAGEQPTAGTAGAAAGAAALGTAAAQQEAAPHLPATSTPHQLLLPESISMLAQRGMAATASTLLTFQGPEDESPEETRAKWARYSSECIAAAS